MRHSEKYSGPAQCVLASVRQPVFDTEFRLLTGGGEKGPLIESKWKRQGVGSFFLCFAFKFL